jgi:hypothetical protein
MSVDTSVQFSEQECLLVRDQIYRVAVEPVDVCKFLCFHRSIVEDSILVGYGAAVSEYCISTF